RERSPDRRAARGPRGTARTSRGAPRTPGPRVRRARRVRMRLSDRVRSAMPCDLFRLTEQLAQMREAGEHPALYRSDRLSEPFGQLRLGESSVVRELDRFSLRIGQLFQRGLDALAFQA